MSVVMKTVVALKHVQTLLEAIFVIATLDLY